MPLTEQQEIQIKQLAKNFHTSLAVFGLAGLRGDFSNLVRIEKPYSDLNVVGLPIAPRDMKYYFTTQTNWEEIIGILNGIVKNYKWEYESRDCDDRAKLVSALASLIFNLNTCGEMFCGVTALVVGAYTGNHYNNIIVTSEGNCILYDVDNSGLYKVIENKTPSFGVWKYNLFNCRF